MNIFIADYVKKCYDGIMIAGSGDFTINGGDSFGTSGGDNDADLGEPVFYYWDIEIVLDHLRPGQHPRSTIGYFPETLNSWLQNYDINLTEQEAKSRMYDIPIRPKVDVFSMVPDWVKFFSDIKQFVQFTNHRAGTKAEATKWLTGV